ncbi:MAG: tetratricopeptide repeat protein [Candidatus Cloacimonetes bacterium]|nr:tetratricopeptide repeat protein [Candidatus Cloacimonadota bacterium]
MYQLNRVRDAAQAFHKAIEKNEQLGNSYFYLARILQKSNENQKALKYFFKAIQNKSDHKDLSFRFSELLAKLKKSLPYSQHKAIYEDAYNKKLYHPDIVYYMIKQAHNRVDYESILEVYQKVKSNDYFSSYRSNSKQNTSFIYYYVSLAYLNEKKDNTNALKFAQLSLKYESNFKAAKSLFDKLRTRLRKRYKVHFDKGTELLISKQFDDAKKQFEMAQAVAPDSQEIKDALSSVKAAKKSFAYTKEAEDLIAKQELTKALKPLKWAITLYEKNFKAKSLLERTKKQITENMVLSENKQNKTANLENQFIKLTKQADNYFESKEFTEAIEKYEEALKLKPKNSRIQQKLKDSINGLKYLKKFQNAKKLHSEQKFAQAADILKEVLKNNYYYEGIDFLLTDAYYQSKNYSAAIKHANKILVSQPRNNEVLYILGASTYYEKPGDTQALDQAIDFLSRAVDVDSSYLDSKSKLRRFQREKYTPFVIALLGGIALLIIIVWFIKTKGLRHKAKFLRKMDKYLENQQFDKIVGLYPESLYVDISILESMSLTPTFIRAFVEVGDYNTAINHGTQFLKTQKNHKQVMISLGRSFYAIEKIDSYTIQFCLAVIGSEYATDDFVTYVGKKCFDQEIDGKKYDPIFLEFSRLYPAHTECRQLLLKHLKDTTRISPQMVELLKAQVEHDAKDTRSRLQLAEYYLSKRKIEDCISLCEEVINLNVTEKKLHVLLYSAYEKMGNIAELTPIYQSLLEVYPNSTVLQQASNKIRMAIQDGQSS